MKTIERKSLLYKTGVEYGDYTINHVQGCAHGCLFPCYAFNMAKRFGKVKSYQEWLEPKLVINSIELLRKELPKLKEKIKSVQLSFTTDPFMIDYPEVGKMSIKIIEELNKFNIPAVVLTKSVLPHELSKLSKINMYGITLISTDEEFRKKFEPFTSDYESRIKALKYLHDKGCKTWVSIEPYPTPNICEQSLKKLLSRINFVDYIVFGMWHYNKLVSGYKNHKDFYDECSEIVMSFCNDKGIKYHIKSGTYSKEEKQEIGKEE